MDRRPLSSSALPPGATWNTQVQKLHVLSPIWLWQCRSATRSSPSSTSARTPISPCASQPLPRLASSSPPRPCSRSSAARPRSASRSTLAKTSSRTHSRVLCCCSVHSRPRTMPEEEESMATNLDQVPMALLRKEEELPFVAVADLGYRQLLQVDLAHGVWVLRFRFPPGRTIQPHKHTG